MSERRRGLGRGLGALIPTDISKGVVATSPTDVFFREDARFHPSPADRADVTGERTPATRDDVSDPGHVAAETAQPAPEGDLAPVPGATYALLPVSAIIANARQPRTAFDEEELQELAHSIRELGVLQPIVVRPRDGAGRHRATPPVVGASVDDPHHARDAHSVGAHSVGAHSVDSHPVDAHPIDADSARPGVGSPGDSHSDSRRPDDVDAPGTATYELVMGERRWRAAQLAGLTRMPAIVKQTPDDAMLRDALLENLHRSQLSPIEEAAAYQQLLDDFGCTHEELAARLGRSRPQISNTIRLLRLPPLVARRVAAGVLSAGHARALLGLADAAAIERLAQRIVAEGLSVRTVEEIVALGEIDDHGTRRRRPDDRRMPELDELAAFLTDRLDTRVSINMGRHKGRLTVEFASVEDLDRILDAIGENAPRPPGREAS